AECSLPRARYDVSQMRLRAVRPETGHRIEHRKCHLPAAQLPVVGDREAVRLVSHLLEQIQRLRVARDAHRFAPARQVDLLEALREARDTDVLQAEFLEYAHSHAELTLATVDNEQVRRIREALPRVRPLVAFA